MYIRYRIRPLTEKEEAVKVSKDVKKLREFEKTLLSNYESYIKDLDFILKGKKTKKQKCNNIHSQIYTFFARNMTFMLT